MGRYVFQAAWKRWAAGLLDGAGYAGAWLLTAGRGLKPDAAVLAEPRSILVVRLDHLGDVLFARPCLQALRRRFPRAHLACLTSRAGAQLLARDAFLDEVLSWEAPWFARGTVPPGQAGWVELARQLRTRRFDVGLELRGDLRNLLLLWRAGVRVRLGYGITGGGFLLHRCLALPAGRHEVERDLAVAAAAGADFTPQAYTPLALSPEELAEGRGAWQGAGPKVVVHPAAGDPAKRWPAGRFARVCAALADAGCEILLVGTAPERTVAEDAAAGVPGVRNLAGRTSLRALAALISAADLLIGNDSGPAHLALTQGIPAVLVWSETNAPEEWGPWGEGCRARVIRQPEREEAVAETVAAALSFLPRR